MTETARRLERLRRPSARARVAAVVLAGWGAALALLAAGIVAVRHDAARTAAVALGWLGAASAVGFALWWARRVAAEESATAMGAGVERLSGARRGSITSLVTASVAGASAELAHLADQRASDVVDGAGPRVAAAHWRRASAQLATGLGTAVLGAVLLVAAQPSSVRAAPFWRPWRVVLGLAEPVTLDVSATKVRRGDSVTARVTAPGASSATLWVRTPGRPWEARALALDSNGAGAARLGPLDADLTLRAQSGRRTSPVVTVHVARPAFLATLELLVRYPAYLERPDDAVVPGADTLPLPVGSVVLTRGRASVALAAAAWRSETGGGRAVPLSARAEAFAGALPIAASGAWTLALDAAGGMPLEGEPARLVVRAIPDSTPLVDVPLPGRDTVAAFSLRQPLVIDARDDHGLTQLELVSRRVSRLGNAGEEAREILPLGEGLDRAVIQYDLVLDGRGLFPGDTLRFRVEARDNAPAPHTHVGVSREYALRLPTQSELRAAARDALRGVSEAADSVAEMGRDLERRTEDAAAGRVRNGETPTLGRSGQDPGTLPFKTAERAGEIASGQEELTRRVEELRGTLDEITRAVEAAGLNDPALQQQIREIQDLLERAITPELAQRLADLRRALEELDPEATREALKELAEQQQWLRAQLERSRDLFRRAAAEGALSTLAQEAEDLRRRQENWNQTHDGLPDSLAAAREREMAAAAESLAAETGQVQQDLRAAQAAAQAQALDSAAQRVEQAGGAMQGAAGAAQSGNRRQAAAQGQRAAETLDPVPEMFRRQREDVARQWREETLAALDRTLAEVAGLAEREREAVDLMRRGEGGPAARQRLAAVEEGVRALVAQVDQASGRHALVSPQLGMALGFAGRQLEAARQELEQATPDPAAAAEAAGASLDALNVAAHALVRSRERVAGAGSGSGFEEAMEQLSQMAQQQGALNSQTSGMMDLMSLARAEALAQLRRLATEQRAMAERLERLRAQGGPASTEDLAREARDVARQLEQGRLDARTLERQQRLFRRLLEAGRTLRGEEEDPREERQSRSASPDQVRLPPDRLEPGATRGPAFRYPSWDQLKGLTPAERQLVLDYFRRLNAPKEH